MFCIASTYRPRSSSTSSASLALCGMFSPEAHKGSPSGRVANGSSQIRQGIASNTKGTAFVVYEDVMDAKQACDKLNGFNFQNRYLVGMFWNSSAGLER